MGNHIGELTGGDREGLARLHCLKRQRIGIAAVIGGCHEILGAHTQRIGSAIDKTFVPVYDDSREPIFDSFTAPKRQSIAPSKQEAPSVLNASRSGADPDL